MSDTAGAWAGCHGVRIGPADLARPYGSSTGEPLVDAELALGDAGAPGDHVVWHLNAQVDLPAGPVTVDQTLTQRADGTFHLGSHGGGVAMAVDVDAARITIDGPYGAVAWQLVATIGLPLLLHAAGVLVVHASAAASRGGAVLVAGASGAGKSSLLVGLVDAGWSAVSEDMCAIDLRGEQPLVLPGPPWVRRAGDGPSGATMAFRTPDKTAWDLSAWRAPGPVPLRSVTFLEPAGGEQVVHRVLSPPEALAALARHAVWLGEQEERAARLFPACVRLLGAVPAASVRVPRDPAWLDLVRPILGA